MTDLSNKPKTTPAPVATSASASASSSRKPDFGPGSDNDAIQLADIEIKQTKIPKNIYMFI
jgi:hypothetical protein